MFPRKRTTPATTTAAPAVVAPITTAAPAAPIVKKKPMTQLKNQFGEVDTQPLWYRLKVAANTAKAGGTATQCFDVKRNQAPHLTNLEEIGAMPNSAEFHVSAIEIVPNANCSAAALKAFLANNRLLMTVGTKNFERVNQPAVIFHSAGTVADSTLDNAARIGAGLYTFKAGEEVHLDPNQPFDLRFVADDDGWATGAGEVLDVFVLLRGQKRSKVSVG